jgi:methyltransferase (TIGR00027 family)
MSLAGMASPAQVHEYHEGVVRALAAFGDRRAAEKSVHALTMGTCGRSRFAEDRLAASLARGVEQLIILGAGLDSIAYRSRDVTRELSVFEVDHPATQAWKRERLVASGVSIPHNLRFVPFDFEQQTLAEALAAGGVRADARSFFCWLGVQPYLTVDAVFSTLDVIAKFPAGSELVLDILTPELDSDPRMSEGGRALLASVGEPFKSRFTRDDFAAQLKMRGFRPVELLSTHDFLLRNSARFGGRFAVERGPALLVTAQLA